MEFYGEIISIGVSASWTICALCMEYASRHAGSLPVNWIRILWALVMTSLLLFFHTGSFLPLEADFDTWFWLSLSGLVGFVFGDICLYSAYVIIGSRFTQLFMTLAPPITAITGIFLLDERMGMKATAGMLVTVSGIAISILGSDSSGSGRKPSIKLPLKGILLGIGAAIGQGVGIVLSKIGMEAYALSSASGQTGGADTVMAFAGSEIRMITAAVAFAAVLLYKGRIREVRRTFSNKKIFISIILGTIFGPFVGVSFSLKALTLTDSGIASTLTSLAPIMILLPAWLIQKQKIRKIEILGAMVSIAGVFLFFM